MTGSTISADRARRDAGLVRPAIVPSRRAVAVGRVSAVLRPRVLVVSCAFAAASCLLVVLAIFVGTVFMPPERVLAALLGGGERLDRLIVVGNRAPRALVGMLAGFALGAAGGITQSLTRNALASPDILGVTTGAGLFAVLVIVLPQAGGPLIAIGVPAAALLGGLIATAVVVLLGWRRGVDTMRLILAGIGINAVGIALTSWLLIIADLETAAVATRWLAGSVAGSTWTDVWPLLFCVVAAIVVAPVVSRLLGTLRYGTDITSALGTRPAVAQAGVLLLAVALVALATAAAGPIGFVAFMAPQFALRIARTEGPPLFLAGLVGSVVVLVADFATRFLPVELPVGVITSVIGAPALLFLLIARVRRADA